MARCRLVALALLAAVPSAGCGGGAGSLEQVWGERGLHPGDFIRPRCIAIDTRGGRDTLYVIDFTGRVQVFDREGHYLRGWSTPTILKGRPAGVALSRDGNVLVADSHYHQILTYSPGGDLLSTVTGRPGEGPGEFGYVSDVVQDEDGYLYVAEFGDDDRIRKLDAQGRYVTHWGGHGSDPGQFVRPRGLALGPDGCLYVADACNHRVQVFTRDGRLVRAIGGEGSGPGQLSYPYDVAVAPGGEVYVLEFGNHRVQKFSPAGESLGTWGHPGRQPGCLNGPWGVAIDSRGDVHVLDTDNDRVQRIRF
jgi:DNA-binding beta-propeller fold protein YncE